jgi:hypothetical protein
MSSNDLPDERVIYRERFQGVLFDFRGRSIFARYDRCEFVKCTLLIDRSTEQLAFTACVFKDCNIDKLEPDEARGLYVADSFFDRPLAERRAVFETRLESSEPNKVRKSRATRLFSRQRLPRLPSHSLSNVVYNADKPVEAAREMVRHHGA